jgi:peptidoglycan/xylan/chitin deacetylase (PgdA/CDA1 family)
MMQHLKITSIVAVAALAGCGGEGERAAPRGTTASAAGSVAPARDSAAMRRPANRMGRIPILEYHVVGDSSKGQFVITRDQFKRDLEALYERGYRPITVAQLIDKDFSDVPAGMSPVVFTFDDASPEQFSYIEKDGGVEIDPTSVIGMWLDFQKEHPDWKNRATFCLLPAAEAGHAFFGDKGIRGQKKEWRFQKVKWLADNGFELCNHTLWHAQLSKYPDAFVQEQIARGQLAIDSVVPGYRVRTFALPQGLWPKNRDLAWRGSWTDPRTKKTTTYNHDTVLEVAGGPAKSPFDPEFTARKLPRVIATGDAVTKLLERLESSGSRFVVVGGDSATAKPPGTSTP